MRFFQCWYPSGEHAWTKWIRSPFNKLRFVRWCTICHTRQERIA